MEFVFTEEQQMMAETLRGFLADTCTPEQLRAMAAEGACFDPERWSALAELGFLGVLVPEDLGGLGLAGPDVIQLAQACGAALLPEPLVETMGVTLPALAALGQTDLLGHAMEGTARVALAHDAAPLAAHADTAQAVLVLRPDAALLTQTPTLTPQASIDPLRALSLVEADAEPLATGAEAAQVYHAALDAGALYTAAQLLGIAQKAVDISVAYASERQQFGKAIGTNQAIKHHLASAQVTIEFARPVLHAAAALTPGAGPETAARISHAKIACGKAAELATKTAVQVHGGMGYSEEVDVHFYLKRALALRATWGTETFHRNRYAARLDSQPFGTDTLFPQEA